MLRADSQCHNATIISPNGFFSLEHTRRSTVLKIPKSHPRYKSLMIRERLVKALEKDLAVHEGLIAHGRGEAFDYLLGERTINYSVKAERVAAAYLLRADNAVISVNGNVAALAPRRIVDLSRIVGAKLEANVFYGKREKRIKEIIKELKRHGASAVLGSKPDARIPGLKGQRALCSDDGLYSSDVVLVPLEDGDRTEALARMGKTVISIDLNPLSRTSQAAHVSIVDELTRAVPNIKKYAKELKYRSKKIDKTISEFDNEKNLSLILNYIGKRLAEL
jgi:4-phosphopantoate--beta-alanine ligase